MENGEKPRLADMIIATTPICAGACIYLLFRGKSILIFQIAEVIGAGDGIDRARSWVRPMNSYFNGFALYSAPTALWAFSFAFCIVKIWLPKLKSLGAAVCIAITVLIALGTELAQAAGLVQGRFDLADLVANLVGVAAGGAVAYARQ